MSLSQSKTAIFSNSPVAHPPPDVHVLHAIAFHLYLNRPEAYVVNNYFDYFTARIVRAPTTRLRKNDLSNPQNN
jgi:hypothetical protein